MKKLLMSVMGMLAVGGVAMGAAACDGPTGHDEHVVGLGDNAQVPARLSSVIADTCVLDTWQLATLASASTRKVLAGGDVILLCLIPRLDGTVGPRDPSATAYLAGQAQALRAEGYHVRLGVSFTDETGVRFDGEQTHEWLASPVWRAQFLSTIGAVSQSVDGLELDFEQLPDNSRADVTTLVQTLSTQIHPANKTLGIFIPPSISIPSDLPDGDAFDLPAIAPYVDRMRVMTLDYSVGTAGPTIDPGWAVDATRLALSQFDKVDISYPLYGTDFGPRGPRETSYDEAIATTINNRTSIQRGPTGAPFLVYRNDIGEDHAIWFDDAQSTAEALGSWAVPTLPPSVGVTFYGLGKEDPALWDELAARMP